MGVDNEMKKVFVDIYLMFNFGDDLFLDILVKKYPNCYFTVNHLGSNYDQFISQYNNVSRRKYTLLNKIGQSLKLSDNITNYEKIAEEHDALLFIGGSIFREEAYHSSLYRDRMKMVMEFKRRKKLVFILGANFGPFKTEEFLDDYRNFFKLCDDVCFRDVYSYQLFEDLPHVRCASDIVFQMNIDEYKLDLSEERIGFSIIDTRHKQGLAYYYNDYISSTIKTIELLVSKGKKCYLMSFCEQEGDLDVIHTIQSRLSSKALDNMVIYKYRGNLKEAIEMMASFKLLIAARFHANILALLLGIGIIPIIYSQKTSNILKDIDFNGTLIDMGNLQLQYDEKVIDASIDYKFNLETAIIKAKKQFEKIDVFLGSESVKSEGI
ncbi:transferase [Bacillus cereus]|uniref:polysaccharide pyruvyl transferase family protein n=1 Tax=Bacillus cereus TaxID=1396 RepID=UPI000BED09FF|nr:polysaccharide pyruvyl transferase family protein [Bacillus cereus]PDZ03261.1 transferase [Bacillus cereus]PFE43103.1 transferase [Bacillus cereus]PFN15465.1 transferase [Bacillus cereus]PGY23365.1 transferase [Bacillus cereus]